MAKIETPIEKVIEDLKKLFDIKKDRNEFGSYEIEGSFGIDKRQFERGTVIGMLEEYFKDKFIEGGYLAVDSITFVFTTFKVLEGKPE